MDCGMVYAWRRDHGRLIDLARRVDVMPLGSGALAGHPFGLDRAALAEDLRFSGGVSQNSMDAVADRDYVAEFLFCFTVLFRLSYFVLFRLVCFCHCLFFFLFLF